MLKYYKNKSNKIFIEDKNGFCEQGLMICNGNYIISTTSWYYDNTKPSNIKEITEEEFIVLGIKKLEKAREFDRKYYERIIKNLDKKLKKSVNEFKKSLNRIKSNKSDLL